MYFEYLKVEKTNRSVAMQVFLKLLIYKIIGRNVQLFIYNELV